MKKLSLLIDTNIVLYTMQGHIPSYDLFKHSNIHLSEITEMELVGYPKILNEERENLNRFFQYTTILRFDVSIKKKAIELMNQYNLSLADAIIV